MDLGLTYKPGLEGIYIYIYITLETSLLTIFKKTKRSSPHQQQYCDLLYIEFTFYCLINTFAFIYLNTTNHLSVTLTFIIYIVSNMLFINNNNIHNTSYYMAYGPKPLIVFEFVLIKSFIIIIIICQLMYALINKSTNLCIHNY